MMRVVINIVISGRAECCSCSFGMVIAMAGGQGCCGAVLSGVALLVYLCGLAGMFFCLFPHFAG